MLLPGTSADLESFDLEPMIGSPNPTATGTGIALHHEDVCGLQSRTRSLSFRQIPDVLANF